MIRYLSIRNLAVIESISVEFEHAFNVLTGETGAGKSILVEAVGLLLGGRASQDLVRTGESMATVEAVFVLPDVPPADAPAPGAPFQPSAAGSVTTREVIVRREITAQGRSRAFIGGALATAAALKELSTRWVELHGQHEHQELLDPLQHLPLLDAWAGLGADQQAVADGFAQVTSLREALDRLRMDSRERAARLELVEFQLAELTRAGLKPGEDEELGSLRQLLRSADSIRRLCAEGFGDLYESEQSVLTGLGRVWKRVGELAAIDPRFGPHLEQRDAIKAELEDLAFTLRDFGDGIDASPGRLEQVEERLAVLDRLKRKHGPALEDVIRRRDALAAEHGALTGGGGSADQMTEQLAHASQQFLQRARRLSESRRAAGARFARAIEGELDSLAMGRTRFEVRLTRGEDEEQWSERGIDTGEFYLSPNVGEDLRPLARIVSGGELSRVMLALKTLAATDQPGKTLIFDEVDAGIGGRVATVVGQRLRALGDRFQVLCITHLPQIAAAGSTHFLIEKQVTGGRTTTAVRRLAEPRRAEEIARMIAGEDAGPPALASARALLDTAKAKGERAPSRNPPRKAPTRR